MKKYLFLLIAVAAFIAPCASKSEGAAGNSQPDYKSELNIVYCTVDGKALELNAFLPANATNPVPAIVEIHGGWWYGGRAASTVKGVGGHQVFVQHGLAVFSIQYRLGKNGGFPECIRDCRNAIRYIRKNAKHFNINPDRIDVMGGSAGGHLSLMVAMVPENFDDGGPTPGLEGVSTKVSGSFSFIPPADFVRFWDHGDTTIGNDETHSRLGVLFHGITPDMEDHQALYTSMSPIGYVRADVPPLLICDGEKDPIVPGLEGKELYEKLRAVGADATYWMTPNGGHSFPGGNGFWKVLDNFIVRTLKLDVSNNHTSQ
jgi:acetyl esterase/lipase